MVVQDDVRTVEVVASLSLATDLAMGLSFEHGLESAVLGIRLARSLGVDDATGSGAYYGSLLYYIGCTRRGRAWGPRPVRCGRLQG